MDKNVQVIEDQMQAYRLSEIRFQFSTDDGLPTVDVSIWDENNRHLFSDFGYNSFDEALTSIAEFFRSQYEDN